MAAEGASNVEIARRFVLSPATVSLWRRRFLLHGLDGIQREAPRLGRSPRATPDLVARLTELVRQGPPPPRTRWTTRKLAQALSLNHMLVHRMLKHHNLSLRQSTPTDGRRRPRVVDVAGFYADQGIQAVVFAVDEPPIAATLPSLISSIDVPLAVSGAYLSNLSHARPDDLGPLLGRLPERVAGSWRRGASTKDLLIFLRAIDRQEPASAVLHLVLHTTGSTAPPALASFLKHHPRFRNYSAPAGGAWAQSVGEWLQSWRSSELHRTSFRRLDQCCSALANLTEGPDRLRDGFRWVSGPRVGYGPALNLPEVPSPHDRPAPPFPRGPRFGPTLGPREPGSEPSRVR